MRLASSCLSTSVLLGAALVASSAGADEPSEVAVGTEPAAAEAELVVGEPEAPEREPLAYNAELLDELLLQSTEATIRQQKLAAAAGIAGGMVMIGLGSWRLIEDEPQSAYSRGLGVMFMTLGMADLTTGVYAATRVPHEKHRLGRWGRARKNGISEVELAHFEGELQASRELREGERLLVRWNGLTHAIAGVLVLAFTPVPDSSQGVDRVTGYVIGGIFVGTGMAAFAASFRSTPAEKAWNDYNNRKMPIPGHEFSWRLAPSISRRGAGLSFGATF
jgi:hypothetical protein